MQTGAIYIDDSGNPGASSGSDFLSSSRKSWTAVIVPDSVANQVFTAMEIFLTGVRQEFGAVELHFTDIYSGRGCWKKVPVERRIKIFDLMKMLVGQFQLPIVHQTVSDETLADHPTLLSQMTRTQGDWWNPRDVGHFGLLFLCFQVARVLRDFHKEAPADFDLPMPLFVDEGIAKEGMDIPLPNWGDAIAGPQACFRVSRTTPGIQIADFVAFVITRTQWIMAQQKLGQAPKRGDLNFLGLTSGFNILNLPLIAMSVENLSKEAYEFTLSRDRQNKGLSRRPKKPG